MNARHSERHRFQAKSVHCFVMEGQDEELGLCGTFRGFVCGGLFESGHLAG
jgi:hypothetical protein